MLTFHIWVQSNASHSQWECLDEACFLLWIHSLQNIPLSGLLKRFGAVKCFYRAPALLKDKTTFHCGEFWFYMRYFSEAVAWASGKKTLTLLLTPQRFELQEESLFQHNCRRSRQIPDLTKGYRLETETLTNTGQSINM